MFMLINSLCVSTVRCLGGITGSMLLGMTRDELKTVCPEEGGRVFYQLQNIKSALAVSTVIVTHMMSYWSMWCHIHTTSYIHSLQMASEVRPLIWGHKLPVDTQLKLLMDAEGCRTLNSYLFIVRAGFEDQERLICILSQFLCQM